MPPKKSKTASQGETAGDTGKFTWTPEMDLKLLYLSSIPRTVGSKEHEEIAKALGTTPGSIRNRVWTVKRDHRQAYVDAGLPVPGGSAVSKVASKEGSAQSTPSKTTPKNKNPKGTKRSAKEMTPDGINDDEPMSPLAKKTKVKNESDLENGDTINIKDEVLNEEF